MENLFQSLYGFGVAVLLVLIQVPAGALLLSCVSGERDGGEYDLERLPFDFTAGFFLSTVLLWGLGLVRMLNVAGAVIYLAAMGGSAVWWYLQGDHTETSDPDGGHEGYVHLFSASLDLPTKLIRVLLVAAAVLLIPYLLQSLLPNADWDGACCHLPLAQRFIDQGLLEVDALRYKFSMPGNVHLMYALFFLAGAESAVIPFNFLISLLTGVAVFVFVRRETGVHGGVIGLLLYASSNIFLELGLDPRIDGILSFFSLIAVYSLHRWLTDRRRMYLFLCAISCGAAAGTKYTAVALIGGIVLVLVGDQLFTTAASPEDDETTPGRFRGVTIPLLLFFLLVPSGFWYVRNAVSLGDPMYPELGKRFVWFETKKDQLRERVRSVVASYPPDHAFHEHDRQWQKRRKASRDSSVPNVYNLVDVLLNPARHARKRGSLHTIHPFLLVFFFFPFVRRNGPSRALFALASGLFLFIGYQTDLTRYLLPALILMIPPAAIVLSRWSHPWYLYPVLLIFLVSFGYNARKELQTFNRTGGMLYLTGKVDRLDWLAEIAGYHQMTGMPRAIRDINRRVKTGDLESTGKVFGVAAEKGRLLTLDFVPDHSRMGNTWINRFLKADRDYGKTYEWLRANEFRYILFNAGYFEHVYRQWGDVYGSFAHFHLFRFKERYGEVVYWDNGVLLIRLKTDLPPGENGG